MTRLHTDDPKTSTLEEHCSFYASVYHLPTTIDPYSKQIVMRVGGVAGAVTMPVRIGREVLAALRIRMLAGPVVEHPQGLRWTFITGPSHWIGDGARADLTRAGASIANPGNIVVLPTFDERVGGDWRWVRRPAASWDFPPQSAVISTVRALTVRSMV